MNRVLLVRWLEGIDVAACQIQMNFQRNAYCFQIHLLLGASTAKLSMPVSKNEPKCRNLKYLLPYSIRAGEKFMSDVRNLVMLVNSPGQCLHQSFFACISNQIQYLLLQPIEILPSWGENRQKPIPHQRSGSKRNANVITHFHDKTIRCRSLATLSSLNHEKPTFTCPFPATRCITK